MSSDKKEFGVDFGELRQRISIYSIAISADIIGGAVADKTLFLACWAKVEFKAERQGFSGHVSADEKSLTIYMRYQTGIHKQMQVEFTDQFYEIQSVNNLHEGDQWLRILAIKSEGS